MNNTKYTPALPLIQNGACVLAADRMLLVDCDHERGENHSASNIKGRATAAYIVRACNGYADAVRALKAAHDTLRLLAEEAGDVPEWNEHGHAYEALFAVRAVLAGNPLPADPAP